MHLTDHPSPSFGPRRDGARPDIVVLHYTAMPGAQAALDRLCDPEIEVSAHYLIACSGEVFRLVDEDMRAWHAGAGAWGAVTDVNSRSIGIELDNTGARPFPEPQMAALEALLPGILSRWSIPPERVIAHSDLAPTRKFDPGTRFDWRRLARQGLSVWPEAEHGPCETGDELKLQNALRQIGYRDGSLEQLLAAFRLRFRPWASGTLTSLDVEAAQDLARRFPVDRTAPSA